MIFILIKITLLISLLAIFYQDQKDRMVYWWLFLIVSIGFSIVHLKEVGWLQLGIHSAFNVVIVLFMLLVLMGYTRLRFQTFNLQSVFALGDILFLLAVAIGFTTVSFIILLVFGLLFSLLIHFALRSIKFKIQNNENEFSRKHTSEQVQEITDTVPLAGYLSLFFVGVLLVHWVGFYDHLYLM